MSHLNEEDLVLHYYGESPDSAPVERHLDECPECRDLYGSLKRVLNVMTTMPVPERGADYGARVWQQIETHLPRRRRFPFLVTPWRWAAAGVALAGLLVAAFLAGRYTPGKPAVPVATDEQTQQQILQVAVGDYLDRSQMVLIELANAMPDGELDISAQQERAANLITENRLYRQTASQTGNTMMAGVLDELERVLLDIAHSPSQLDAQQVDELRQRLRTEGILFRIRVLSSNVQSRETHKL